MRISFALGWPETQEKSHVARIGRLVDSLSLVSCCPLRPSCYSSVAQLWRAPTEGQTLIMVEKRAGLGTSGAEDALTRPPTELYEPLPSEVLERLGPSSVDYEAFVVAYLPKQEVESLRALVHHHDLALGEEDMRIVKLGWHAFEVGDAAGRVPARVADRVLPQPVPGLFLVRIGYPIKSDWLDELTTCGIEQLAYFGLATYLVRASDAHQITSCAAVGDKISWIDVFYNTDRVSVELIDGEAPHGYWLQYFADTDIAAKLESFPKGLEAVDTHFAPADGAAFVQVRSSLDQLLDLVASDTELLSVSRAGVGTLSDERQGQIIAGAHNGTSLTGPGYLSWLTNRGLRSSGNQQVVAIMDTGYDDGSSPIGDHHPDLENPERLVAQIGIYGTLNRFDEIGHGTMVAGILVGNGAGGTDKKDSQGYHYGTGIAPDAKLVAAHVSPLFDLGRQQDALDAACASNAHIANNSWNMQVGSVSTGVYLPKNEYDVAAQFYDHRVLDACTTSGAQWMNLVFSAGNFRDYCGTTTNFDSVSSPATAKNVIAVGATENYRPAASEGPPNACKPCTAGNYGRPRDHDSTNVSRVASFSGRGKHFSYAYGTRVKPDLVAPGVRTFSTVPYDLNRYDSNEVFVGCARYYPDTSGHGYHTYGTGTSFAAPVVSGALALKRKWFLDRGTTPSPSLLKAALIATADSLGGIAGQDHRPSPIYGWGRVNLNRLTDSRGRFYRTDNLSLAVGTGQSRSWTQTIDCGSCPTFIVLAWSDPPNSSTGNSQVPVVNDLALRVNGGLWQGNYFNEWLGPAYDDGYSYFWNPGMLLNDTMNNVEAVFIPASTYSSGQAITLTATGISVPQGPQRFALYAYNVN